MISTIHNTVALQTLKKAWRQKNERIAFVPTMGNLHDGHLALVQKAKQVADRVIVSIFVNPLQFGPHEDFLRYPKTLKADVDKLTFLDVDAIFAPGIDEIYPDGKMPLTRVIVPGLSDDLCGITRPQLFYGVTTVVSKLFNIVQPDIAIFGEKDFQQLLIIQQMVKDLNFPIEILSGSIVRETDGLALSSRNQYLNGKERKIAPELYKILCWLHEQIRLGRNNYDALCETATKQLLEAGFEKIDYVAIRDKDNLKIPTKETSHLIILAAAFIGKTRLIDNVCTKVIMIKCSKERENARY